ncbi:MAG: DUF4388 domain-containing protein [Desulfobacterales bacterium]
MNKILLVDIDTATLTTFSDLLKGQSDDIEILTASHVREVPNIISGVKVNMIVVDLKMPDNDDLEFLGYLSRDYPKIPVIVITAFGTSEIEEKIRMLGTCHYYQKPIDLVAISEKIFEEFGVGVGGQIHGIALSSFLQMSEMEKTTCRLKIKSEQDVGYLYLQKGELIAAETGMLQGNDAAYEIISWENAVIEIEKSRQKKKREIKMPLMNILMEGLRIKDEQNEEAEKKKPADVSSSLKLDVQPEMAPLQTQPEDEKIAPSETPKIKPGATEEKLKAGGVKSGGAAKALKRKRLVSIFAGLAVIIAVGMAWIHIIKPRLLHAEFQKVLIEVGSKSSLEEKENILQDYIDSHEPNKYTLEAKTKIKEIFHLIQERDFEIAVNQVNNLPVDNKFMAAATEIYSAYLDKFSAGIRADDIKKKISEIPSIVDDNDYEEIKEIDPNEYEKRVTLYQAYLKNHPQGKYRGEVQQLITDISEMYYQYVKKEISICDKEKDWSRCIELCDKYIISYSASKKLPEIKGLRNSMYSRNVIKDLKEEISGKGSEYKAAQQVYVDYLNANPDSIARDAIRLELQKINKKIREKNAWEKIAKYTKNKKVDLFKRIEKLEKYMAGTHEAKYQKGAEVLMKRLGKEKQEYIRKRRLVEEQKRMERERLAAIQREKARLQREKIKIGSVLSESSGRFVVGVDGTVTDQQTGLMWYIFDTHTELQECLDYDAAKEYVENLNVGGYKDWRLPTPNDLIVILNAKSSFPKTGAKWYWSSEAFWKGHYEFDRIVIPRNDNQWIKGEAELTECGAVRAVRP